MQNNNTNMENKINDVIINAKSGVVQYENVEEEIVVPKVEGKVRLLMGRNVLEEIFFPLNG